MGTGRFREQNLLSVGVGRGILFGVVQAINSSLFTTKIKNQPRLSKFNFSVNLKKRVLGVRRFVHIINFVAILQSYSEAT
jgi:hypothetical protein